MYNNFLNLTAYERNEGTGVEGRDLQGYQLLWSHLTLSEYRTRLDNGQIWEKSFHCRGSCHRSEWADKSIWQAKVHCYSGVCRG